MTKELQQILYTQIPPTKLLDFKVESYQNSVLSLSAPLSLNHNDKSTGFGGSLEMLNIITGWSATWILLKEKGISCDVVIRKVSSNFKKPANGDFITYCKLPKQDELEKMWLQYERKGKSKISFRIELYSNEILCLETQSEYVFLK